MRTPGGVFFHAMITGFVWNLASWLVLPVLICLGHGDAALVVALAVFVLGALAGAASPSLVPFGIAAPAPTPEEADRARRYAHERARLWRARRATATYYAVLVLAVLASLGCVGGSLVAWLAPSWFPDGWEVAVMGVCPAIVGGSLPYLIAVNRFGSWSSATGRFDTDPGFYDAGSCSSGDGCGSSGD